MSRFVCSKDHYLKTLDLLLRFSKNNEAVKYKFGLRDEDLVICFCKYTIENAYRQNCVSCNEKVDDKFIELIWKYSRLYYDAINYIDKASLYNMLRCIEYQFTDLMDTKNIDDICNIISNGLVAYITDTHDEVIRWTYDPTDLIRQKEGKINEN